MPCACSLPATTTAPFQTEASTLICTLAAKNATPPRLGLHAQRALILAILFIMLISWPLLVCAEAAHAGWPAYPHLTFRLTVIRAVRTTFFVLKLWELCVLYVSGVVIGVHL